MLVKKVDRYFGDILIRSGRLDKDKLHYALNIQRNSNTVLLTGQILVSNGYIKEEDITEGLAVQYGLPFLPLDEYEVDRSLMSILPIEFLQKYDVFPIEKIGNSLSIGMANPLEREVVKEIRDITSCHVTVFICTKSAIKNKKKLLLKHLDNKPSDIAEFAKREVLS